ncbi:hypothetical protein GQF61_11825 [Sphingobacterium sp. DK4209]|uniref:Tetratricopeptide repeat protein n=1 Tax=Sphingobacterium zhuxiongii TaxID=2662364 RepID=A0A5Q0QC98_9SPHI|nr:MULTISPECIES: hypothetical protein [unclassified Sphingobacterium]MVZ66550.1 hypothetical protein [Sphingobacterium sp. DK4209]QGA27797.1 hypothetical protein GFH32_16365 [Sphingobacterium sp. dk4302]
MDQLNIFRKALENPLEVNEGDFQFLLSKYPYSQPIVFANERRKQLAEQSVDKQRTLLYAYNAFWLRDYLQKPVNDIPEIEVDSDEYISFEELASHPDAIEAEAVSSIDEESFDNKDIATELPTPDENIDQTNQSTNVEQNAIADDEEIVDDEIDASQLFDYERYALGAKPRQNSKHLTRDEEKPLQESTIKVEVVLPSVKIEEEANSEENISLYNDELMPYSFRWWLYKTRLEHADTYQPFAQPVLPKPQKGQFDPQKLDEAILDQQIRENIFHLQNPEDKLSERFKKETVEFNPVQESDEVIDKFIREEPQIQPPKAEEINNENKARRSSEDHLSVVTETLANIYEGQAMYQKAIQVFKKLISENPEKKLYFATRIKELEQKL